MSPLAEAKAVIPSSRNDNATVVKTTAATIPHTDSQTGQKRKSRPKGNRFKVVGHMVMAMKRFQESLNPTYTFGKQQPTPTTSSGRAPSLGHGDKEVSSSKKRNPAYSTHGHKANFIFSPLPPTEGEQLDSEEEEEEEKEEHAGK